MAASQYIDVSGDGDIAKFAGLEQVELWQDYHKVCGGPTSLVFGMTGVDTERMVAENPNGAVQLSHADTGMPGIISEQYAFTHAKDPERYKAVADLDMRLFGSMSSIHLATGYNVVNG